MSTERTAPESRFLVVRRIGTNEEVHRIDVSAKPNGQADRAPLGMLRQLDLDRFWLEDTADVTT